MWLIVVGVEGLLRLDGMMEETGATDTERMYFAEIAGKVARM
jgi:hypothetical protein